MYLHTRLILFLDRHQVKLDQSEDCVPVSNIPIARPNKKSVFRVTGLKILGRVFFQSFSLEKQSDLMHFERQFVF